eukprot:352597-Chlamydomonas_euryale.AAC.11
MLHAPPQGPASLSATGARAPLRHRQPAAPTTEPAHREVVAAASRDDARGGVRPPCAWALEHRLLRAAGPELKVPAHHVVFGITTER